MSSPTWSSSSSDSSSSSSSSIRHQGSLVDPALHSPTLLRMLDYKITKPVIEYVVDTVAETVDFAMGRPSTSRGRSTSRSQTLIKFTDFVNTVLSRAEVTMPTLLATLVYVSRAKPHLHIGLEQWALERVFLGALIVASKNLNDSTLKNVHWALCTGVFGKRDIGRIEREYLNVLNFELKVSESDLLAHHEGLEAAIYPAISPVPVLDFSTHTEKRRHHRRNVVLQEPESPTSPASSTSSSSSGSSDCCPLTPSSAGTSPISASPYRQKPQVAPQPTSRRLFSGTTMDLLRAFPLPGRCSS
ncbi:hypothetical protein CVT24_011151 [Panaeolus cyanescens]|uniref:Cyclin N-terminal domain-containing protein n=1 Tax=Panaeolus cyanescens TaxID=181874 RepID=A0A409YGE3_9AGAR|nr:hypothetical protein CVT24_011151 [Panaeolus cyanescens]